TEISAPVRDILEAGTFHPSDDAYLLPDQQLDRALYEQVNKILSHFGGKWEKKGKRHTFPVGGLLKLQAALRSDEPLGEKNPDAFFESPRAVADYILDQLCHMPPVAFMLEPSAGTGALARAMVARYPDAPLDVCEIDADRRLILY